MLFTVSAKQPAAEGGTRQRQAAAEEMVEVELLREPRQPSGPAGRVDGQAATLGPRAGCSTIAYLEADRALGKTAHSLY